MYILQSKSAFTNQFANLQPQFNLTNSTNTMTLIQYLKSLKSFKFAFQDSSFRKDDTKVTRLKCYNQLTASDLKKVKAAVKNCPNVIEVNNDFQWKEISRGEAFINPTFIIRMINQTPSQIIPSKYWKQCTNYFDKHYFIFYFFKIIL